VREALHLGLSIHLLVRCLVDKPHIEKALCMKLRNGVSIALYSSLRYLPVLLLSGLSMCMYVYVYAYPGTCIFFFSFKTVNHKSSIYSDFLALVRFQGKLIFKNSAS